LINNPDVAFLVNHRGVTMARTTNQSLTLAKDSTGLAVHAYLNADRQDVRDLASAIRDGLISEMSFAFALNGGEWSEDYETYTITEADIDRGDVSAVNYGANPYTSIEARSAEWLRDIKRMPVPVARAAFQRITTRLADLGGVDLSDIASWEVVDETGPEKATADRPAMKERATEADDDPASLAQAVDAVLDEAIKLLSGVDVESLPPDVQQAIALITGADTIIDELLEVTGVPDPDDVEVEARAGGKSLNLWRLRVEQSARV
jgi:HK97 family phage prohead protease